MGRKQKTIVQYPIQQNRIDHCNVSDLKGHITWLRPGLIIMSAYFISIFCLDTSVANYAYKEVRNKYIWSHFSGTLWHILQDKSWDLDKNQWDILPKFLSILLTEKYFSQKFFLRTYVINLPFQNRELSKLTLSEPTKYLMKN